MKLFQNIFFFGLVVGMSASNIASAGVKDCQIFKDHYQEILQNAPKAKGCSASPSLALSTKAADWSVLTACWGDIFYMRTKKKGQINFSSAGLRKNPSREMAHECVVNLSN